MVFSAQVVPFRPLSDACFLFFIFCNIATVCRYHCANAPNIFSVSPPDLHPILKYLYIALKLDDKSSCVHQQLLQNSQ